jgi:hypothetical protein
MGHRVSLSGAAVGHFGSDSVRFWTFLSHFVPAAIGVVYRKLLLELMLRIMSLSGLRQIAAIMQLWRPVFNLQAALVTATQGRA